MTRPAANLETTGPDPLDSVLVQTASGYAVALHDLGGSGRPLLMAHATGFCGATYLPLAAHLRSHFHVWALDHRGHGDSDPLPADGEVAWSGLADDVLAAATVLGPGPVAIFGHSMGGAAALLAAAIRPGTFVSLYVYEPILEIQPRLVDPVAMEMGRVARRRRAEFNSGADAYDRLSVRMPFSTIDPAALHSYVKYALRRETDGLLRLKCTPETEARCYESQRKITLAQLASVSSRVTIGLGLREAGEPAACTRAVASSLADAVLVSYETLGHMGPLERPDLVATSLLECSPIHQEENPA